MVVRPPIYHFSGPKASRKPPDDEELSDPRLERPLIGVDAPGGDMLSVPRGELTPGDRASGAVCICDCVLFGLPEADVFDVGWILEVEVFGFVDIDLVFE